MKNGEYGVISRTVQPCSWFDEMQTSNHLQIRPEKGIREIHLNRKARVAEPLTSELHTFLPICRISPHTILFSAIAAIWPPLNISAKLFVTRSIAAADGWRERKNRQQGQLLRCRMPAIWRRLHLLEAQCEAGHQLLAPCSCSTQTLTPPRALDLLFFVP